jgi:hypothetical protein
MEAALIVLSFDCSRQNPFTFSTVFYFADSNYYKWESWIFNTTCIINASTSMSRGFSFQIFFGDIENLTKFSKSTKNSWNSHYNIFLNFPVFWGWKNLKNLSQNKVLFLRTLGPSSNFVLFLWNRWQFQLNLEPLIWRHIKPHLYNLVLMNLPTLVKFTISDKYT